MVLETLEVLCVLLDQFLDGNSIDLHRPLDDVVHHLRVLACAILVDQ